MQDHYIQNQLRNNEVQLIANYTYSFVEQTLDPEVLYSKAIENIAVLNGNDCEIIDLRNNENPLNLIIEKHSELTVNQPKVSLGM
jgi:hypothetical protein